MRLREVIDMPCGIRYIVDRLELQSGYARQWLLDMPLFTDARALAATYAVLRRFALFLEQTDATTLNTLLFKLSGLKGIGTTLGNLRHGVTLDDVELYEVKHLAMLAGDVKALLLDHGIDEVVHIADLHDVVAILDPDGLKIATFYIYDSYNAELCVLRQRMRQHPADHDALLEQAATIESGVRDDLCRQLCPYADALEQAMHALAHLDVVVAKARQTAQWHLCFPTIADDDTTHYRGLFNPQVKDVLATQHREFQPVDIDLDNRPTLLTGANMGGKTVVLKTVALCQLLMQFAFGVPAASATVAVVDDVRLCIGDEQSVERGLSSFAAEMKNIDALIQASRRGVRILAVVDEPARTTNPTEGAALVASLANVLAQRRTTLLLTTHYHITTAHARRLRVRGFENGTMDYSLVEVAHGEVPHEALRIARSLGIDEQWLTEAQQIIDNQAT